MSRLPLGTARHLCHTAAFFGSVSVSLHASPQKGPVWAKHSGGMQIPEIGHPGTPGKLENKNLPKTVHREANAMLYIAVFSDFSSMFLFGSVCICKI